ncbi:hypothetical protein SLEP1_g7890 [Rubroshorea leprosula]|uniref:Uncharacterized protein n=1 Tax=Rubroshorea leprosula TaxID=152421 RepID=A0AAV5IAV3_9ROSI|nr:hypothetical protein SLEP1_g7890 [Rubroshorea leprosula]
MFRLLDSTRKTGVPGGSLTRLTEEQGRSEEGEVWRGREWRRKWRGNRWACGQEDCGIASVRGVHGAGGGWVGRGGAKECNEMGGEDDEGGGLCQAEDIERDSRCPESTAERGLLSRDLHAPDSTAAMGKEKRKPKEWAATRMNCMPFSHACLVF